MLRPRMKVGHFIDSFDPGGAETLVIELCRKLPTFGISTEVYHFGNPWLEEMCKRYGIVSVRVPDYKYYRSIRTLPFFAWVFRRFLKTRSIDLLHSHLFGSIVGSCLVANSLAFPHIGTIHDVYTLEEKKGRIRLLQLAAILGTRLIAVSPSIEKYLRRAAFFPGKSLQVIMNGVDLERFGKSATRRFDSRSTLEGSKVVFISVGRLVDLKGHDILIKAFSLIHSSVPWRLMVVGDGPERNKLDLLIRKERMEGKITLLGERDDIPELLVQSDCFILPSHSEGLSCSLIEAMASGLPAVATSVGGNSLLIRNDESGYLVPPKDPVALAVAIKILLENREKRKEFGEKALREARERFSLDTMVASYVRHYQEITL